MKAHDALKGTSIATVAENPCARMQNMHEVHRGHLHANMTHLRKEV